MDGRTAAAVLGVTQGATKDEIRRAYRARVKLAHPDASGTDEAFIALRTAFDQLMITAPAVVAPAPPARAIRWVTTARPATAHHIDLLDARAPAPAATRRPAVGVPTTGNARAFAAVLEAQLVGR